MPRTKSRRLSSRKRSGGRPDPRSLHNLISGKVSRIPCVGGTWYWNRYPGARFDSESYSYAYSFSKELLAEWDWSEHFSPQPETLRYLNHVADRFDLRRDIRLRSRVSAAHFHEETRNWELTLEGGSRFRSRFLITAIGFLSAHVLPRIEGVDAFKGQSFHTARWPHEPVSFAGKRVAVVGTGATGVQTIAEVARTAAHLTVFQRTPNWCTPLHNRKIDAAEMAQIALVTHNTRDFSQAAARFGLRIVTPGELLKELKS